MFLKRIAVSVVIIQSCIKRRKCPNENQKRCLTRPCILRPVIGNVAQIRTMKQNKELRKNRGGLSSEISDK